MRPMYPVVALYSYWAKAPYRGIYKGTISSSEMEYEPPPGEARSQDCSEELGAVLVTTGVPLRSSSYRMHARYNNSTQIAARSSMIARPTFGVILELISTCILRTDGGGLRYFITFCSISFSPKASLSLLKHLFSTT